MKGQRAEGLGLVRRAWVAGVVAAIAIAAGVVRAETIDRVLAVAGGQVIMLSDVTAALDLGLVPDGGAVDRNTDQNTDQIGAALAKLIDRALVLVEVNRYAPPEPADDAIARELASVRARFPSQQAFASALERSGITEAQLREISRDNLRIRAYIGQRFAGAENEARRLTLFDEWVAGLRTRSDIIDLYATGR
jgi:parvulin-like peptidyl-prolyl isomerase